MEALHKPWEKSFVSDVVRLQDWFTEASQAAALFHFGSGDEDMGAVTEESIMVDMCARLGNVDPMHVLQLEAETDPQRLLCGEEVNEENPFSSDLPAESRLAIIRAHQTEQEKKEKLSYRQEAMARLQYKRYNFKVLRRLKLETHKNASPIPAGLRTVYQPTDMLLTVVLCKPYNRPLEFHEIRLGRLMALDMVFLVRGDTELTALRDKIACASDFATSDDLSDKAPAEIDPVYAKTKYPSGFFYIHNTFYDDRRMPESIAYSQEILDWAARHSDEVDAAAMTSESMEGRLFRDLTLRLGQPYLYLHQGSCEHLFMVTNVRLMHPDDCQDAEHYPICISSKPKKRTPCAACKRYTAKWVVYGSDRLPFDPGFFCEACFRAFFYDGDGNKVGNFQAVVYHDKSAIVTT